MAYELKKTVVLVGMMGSGKTAVGSALARQLDVPFLDSDTEIVHAANMTIPEIFERDGEPSAWELASTVGVLFTLSCALVTLLFLPPSKTI